MRSSISNTFSGLWTKTCVQGSRVEKALPHLMREQNNHNDNDNNKKNCKALQHL